MHAATGGEAVLRPTFVAFPEDARCAEEGDELMFGPFLLAAPVVAPGERGRRLYLPNGPASWFDFWTEEVLAPGAETILAAPLDRLPMVVPAGAILPMTDAGEDYSRLHDEPTRSLKIFPGPAAGGRRFVLFEDDGISAEVNATRVTFDLAWTAEEITLSVSAEGDYPLPYRQIRVIPRQAERRRIRLNTAEGAPRLALR
jgi:alpha-glucosidase